MTGENKTMPERMVRAEQRFEDHEKRCDERQMAMGREIRELKDSVSGLNKGAWMLAIAILAWAAQQLYIKIDYPARLPQPVASAAPH